MKDLLADEISEKGSVNSSSAASPNRSIIYCYNTPMEISPKVNKNLLSMLSAIIYFAYAMENVWITALMIIYQTPNIVDAFIWIIPNILAILIRPYLHRYINSVQIAMIREVPIVTSLLLIAGSGCLLVGYSTNYIAKGQLLSRIIPCTLGWTMMDTAMELAEQIIEKMNQFIDRNFKAANSIQSKTVRALSSVSAYLVIFSFIGATKKGSSKLFYINCKKFYYFTGWVTIIGAIIFKILYEVPNNSNVIKKPSIEKKSKGQQFSNMFVKKFACPQFFLPGLYQLKDCSLTVKMLLLVHFCVQYLSDMVLIYATMWFVVRSQSLGVNQGSSYSNGMRDGSLALATYTLVQQYISRNLKDQNIFGGIVLLSAVFVAMGFYNLNMFWIYGITISLGICVGYYQNYVKPCWQQIYPVFQTCQQLIERIQRIFVLSIMPFVIMILLERNDVTDCIGVGLLVMILIAYCFFKSQQRIQHGKFKDGKIKFK